MGGSCNTINEDESQAAEEGQKEGLRRQISQTVVRTINPPPPSPTPFSTQQLTTDILTDSGDSNMTRTKNRSDPYEWDTVASLDKIIDYKLAVTGTPAPKGNGNGKSVSGSSSDYYYHQNREELRRRERALDFEWKCAGSATPREHKANRILQALRRHDEETVYGAQTPREGFGGQLHPRFAGDHFLYNKDLIDRTKVFRLARKAPKGAHLHIHFNACLRPNVLLEIAREMGQMYITSDVPLTVDEAQGRHRRENDNYQRCRLKFSIMTLTASKGNLFDAHYKDRLPMKFQEFLEEFPQHYPDEDAMHWLQEKLIFHEEEAHSLLQTVDGAWEMFNARTQMMKGLFNYETAYRTYTRKCLEDFVADNIQYAEIRPNFMDTNQVWTDDGTKKINNVGIVEMIMDEYKKFQAQTGSYFGGMKIIYCCPRSWPNEKVAGGLRECLEFKKRWPEWIAGFDLVGEEGKGKPLSAFVKEFLQFQDDCKAAGVEIPFLFHCGETLEVGSETDDNLLDALLLKSKRIGHGFALARHPYIMERMKKENICLEVCPISNEVLGLTPRADGHSVYGLLANNVHCTVSSDNGTLFNSTLSHDFYQVMIGRHDMTLFGWKQLIEWSLEHACMSKDEYDAVYGQWAKRWDDFVGEIIEEFGDFDPTPDIEHRP
ncbi:Adenosine deaminase CECR1-A [Cytospora mali]|uniref:adenosine deaminase n=1 Tax=Cytospora mali TaxID=578113 RepID=A0A194UN45_CYTMA|nr:Adenosine deaminase CECR1-A [Valsa mali var. pyri (nom. inval.)]